MNKNKLLEKIKEYGETINSLDQIVGPRETWISGVTNTDFGPCRDERRHVHFEVFLDLEDYLDNMTDIEVEWFKYKVEDRSMVTMGAWRSRRFFNYRAAYHYHQWGNELEERVTQVNGRSFSMELDRLYMSAKWDEALLLLTHSRLSCRHSGISNVTIETGNHAVKQMVIDIDSRCLREVVPLGQAHGRETNGDHWLEDMIIETPRIHEEWHEYMTESEKKDFYNMPIVSSGKNASAQVVFLDEEILNEYKDERIELEEKLQMKNVDSMYNIELLDKNKLIAVRNLRCTDVEVYVPGFYPTVSLDRWSSSTTKLPPIVIPPRIDESLVPIVTLDIVICAIVGNEVWLDEKVLVQRRNCSCVTERHKMCAVHGGIINHEWMNISVFCPPEENTEFIIDWSNGRAFIGPVWTVSRQNVPIPRNDRIVPRDDAWFLPFFFRSPAPFAWQGGPLSFISSSTQIEARLWVENGRFVGSIGSGDVTDWGFPADSIMCMETALPEFSISITIVFIAIMYEATFSRRDLQVLTRPTYLVTPKMGFEPVKEQNKFEGFSAGVSKKSRKKRSRRNNKGNVVNHQKT